MKDRKPIPREGKRGKEKRMNRKKVQKGYFNDFGDDSYGGCTAPCQACMLPMERGDKRMWTHPETAHKIPRSLQGSDEPENAVILHAICHSRFDLGDKDYKHWQDILKNTPVSAKTGGYIGLSDKDLRILREFGRKAMVGT